MRLSFAEPLGNFLPNTQGTQKKFPVLVWDWDGRVVFPGALEKGGCVCFVFQACHFYRAGLWYLSNTRPCTKYLVIFLAICDSFPGWRQSCAQHGWCNVFYFSITTLYCCRRQQANELLLAGCRLLTYICWRPFSVGLGSGFVGCVRGRSASLVGLRFYFRHLERVSPDYIIDWDNKCTSLLMARVSCCT